MNDTEAPRGPDWSAMEDLDYPSAIRLEREIRRLERQGRDGLPAKKLRVVLGGNCNVDFLAPGLRAALFQEDIHAEVELTDYDDWIGAALSGRSQGDVWVIWLSSLGFSRGGQARPPLAYDQIFAAAEALTGRGSRSVIILPEPLLLESDPFSPFASWRSEISSTLRGSPALSGAVFLDPDPVLRQVGSKQWHAERYWVSAKCPCHPNAATRLAQQIGATLARMVKPKVRAIVVDLDNTLWGGILGEDGVHGLELDPHGAGAPFLALQRFLKDLSERGVPLSVASKNDPDEATEAFAQRPEMILKRDDFVYFEAGWEEKAKSIVRIAEGLNLGLESLCFLDDSPHERAEARFHLPDLIVPELPEAPEERLAYLVGSRLFYQPVVGADDVKRVAFYKGEAARKHAAAVIGDQDSYLRSLDMKLRPMRIGLDNLTRVESLVQKTNQFNLTNRRHGASALKAFVDDPEAYAYCYAVHDRFGEAGIVGVLLATVSRDSVAEIDTWLMSCRVINRGVEFAMYEHLAGWARARGVEAIKATYVASKRNGQVADLYDRLQLQRREDDQDGVRYRGSAFVVPKHFLEIESDATATAAPS